MMSLLLQTNVSMLRLLKPSLTNILSTVNEKIIAILEQGEKCRKDGKCNHLIVLEHKNNKCIMCDCDRSIHRSKKGMSVIELFDLEAV